MLMSLIKVALDIRNIPGGTPLGNVIGKGGIANREAAAIVPPATAAGAAASDKVSSNPSKRQSLV